MSVNGYNIYQWKKGHVSVNGIGTIYIYQWKRGHVSVNGYNIYQWKRGHVFVNGTIKIKGTMCMSVEQRQYM